MTAFCERCRKWSAKLYRWSARLGLGCSALLLLSMSLGYAFQPDALAALTSLPPWVWLLPGILSVLLSLGGDAKRSAAGLLVAWLLFGAFFIDEVRNPISWGRISEASWRLAQQEGRAVRVISLNCGALRKVAAVSEVLPYEPDIVLLQESPPKAEVEALSRRLFGKAGAYVWDIDASILVRGAILRTFRESASRLTQARVRLPSGLEAEVINSHFWPTAFRIDFWSSECRRAHAARRRLHRDQVQKILRRLDDVPQDDAVLLGGDFNVEPWNGVLRPLRRRLHDAFREGGKGLGHTFSNDMPLARIDQVWISPHFQAAAVSAVRTVHSDHRMVLCDLIFASEAKSAPVRPF